ncbi:MAG: heme-binding protein [Lachnospiraceae bacterium]|nr:heme-binding protein [Lachnospiraceae bacterium]
METTVRDIIRKMKASSTMNLKLALALIERVEAEAEKMGVKAVVAVSDASGRPVAVHCMDGAYIGSFDVALNKTYTSVAFRMSTAKLAELAAPGGSLYGIQFTNEGKIVIFGGGEPLYLDDVMVGAIGVSGGTAEQDTYLGAYGKDGLKELLQR